MKFEASKWASFVLTASLTLSSLDVVDAKKSRVPKQRLSHDVAPQHYHVTLVPKRDCSFSGSVAIQLDVTNSTNQLVFNAQGLEIDEDSVTLKRLNKDAGEIDILQINNEVDNNEYNAEENYKNLTLDFTVRDFVTLGSEEPLSSPGRYLLYMEFNGTMNSRRTLGLYCSPSPGTGKHKDRTGRWMVASAFEPNLASTAFPCWDEPGFKANFTISLAHDNRTVTLSNMPLRISKPYDNSDGEGWRLDTFHTTPKMSPYLVGVMISENVAHLDSKLNGDRPLRIWGHPGRVQYGDLPLRLAKRHMEFLEDYMSFQDPLPKQDMLTVRNYIAGGLENWGIVSYDEKLILFDPRYRRNKQVVLRCSNLIAHELSHIWFGNLVTPNWWDDIWLSEGFSSYFAVLSTSKVYPVWGHETASWILARENSMEVDARDTTHPLRPQLSPGSGFREVFDQIIYNKGQSIVRMLNFTIGEQALKEGLRNYIRKRAYATASHDLLWSELEKAAGGFANLPENVSLAEVMDSWLNRPGYPVVSVIRDYSAGEITISQRSILDKEDAREDASAAWWIPLTYTYDGENGTTTSVRLWLNPAEINTTIDDPAPSDKWLLFNLHGAGYYRVRYDRDNAAYLLNDLSDLWLDDRVQVVSDMVELARLGFSPVSDALNALSSMKNEMSPYPWLAILGSAHKTLSLFRGTELEDMFTEFLNEILSVGMTRVEEDDVHRKELVSLSCEVGVTKCTKMADELFKKWAEDPNHKIPEDIRGSVYCYGVAHGDSKSWQMVNSRFASSADAKDKKDLLKALACTKDSNLLSKYLKWTLEPSKGGPGSKKTSTMFKALAKRDPEMLLSALVSQETDKKRNPRWKKLLEHVALEVNNEKQLNQLRQLLMADQDEFKSDFGGNAVISMAESNVEWLERNAGQTKAWLKKHEAMSAVKSKKLSKGSRGI